MTTTVQMRCILIAIFYAALTQGRPMRNLLQANFQNQTDTQLWPSSQPPPLQHARMLNHPVQLGMEINARCASLQ